MVNIDLKEKDLRCIMAYMIDKNNCLGMMKTLKLLNQFGCSFDEIAQGRRIHEKIKRGDSE